LYGGYRTLFNYYCSKKLGFAKELAMPFPEFATSCIHRCETYNTAEFTRMLQQTSLIFLFAAYERMLLSLFNASIKDKLES
jgi:hypothetical protein